jgi:hypothetical protein
MKNETSTLVNLLSGKVPITMKWVYKMKIATDGSVEKLKAHLVVQLLRC